MRKKIEELIYAIAEKEEHDDITMYKGNIIDLLEKSLEFKYVGFIVDEETDEFPTKKMVELNEDQRFLRENEVEDICALLLFSKEFMTNENKRIQAMLLSNDPEEDIDKELIEFVSNLIVTESEGWYGLEYSKE